MTTGLQRVMTRRSPLKICMVTTFFGAHSFGGDAAYVDRLARALGALGVTVDIFTRSGGGPAREEIAEGVQLVMLPSGPGGPLAKDKLSRYAASFAAAIAADAQTHAAAYDIVHSHYWQSGVAALRLARRWVVPLVLLLAVVALAVVVGQAAAPYTLYTLF